MVLHVTSSRSRQLQDYNLALGQPTLKDPGEEAPSQWAELQAVHGVIHFVQKEKWSDGWLFAEWLVRDLERAWLGNGWERHLGKKYVWIDFSKWAKDVEILVSHVHAPQKVTSEKEEFNHQADRMTHPLDIQPLSQAIPVIAQWAHKRVAMVTEKGLTTRTATHQGWPGCSCC